MSEASSRSAPQSKSPGLRVPKVFLGVVVFLATALLAWEMAITAGLISPFLVARPSAIAVAFAEGIRSGSFFYHGGITAFEALAGFTIATATGLVIGTLVAEVRLIERAVYPWLVAIQATPKIALAPILIIWFGFGLSSKIAVATIICLFPVMVTTVAGLRATPAGLLDAARSMGASRWQVMRLIKFPAALPYIFAGISLASVFAFTGAIVGEFIGATKGLGFLIVNANSRIQLDQAFAALLAVAILGMAFFYAVKAVSKRVLYWSN